MQRHHHQQDARFGGVEGRRLGGEHSSHMQDRDDRGRFEGVRDSREDDWRRRDRDDGRYGRNDNGMSAYGDDRSGYRSNDNARFGGGYQAGATSGEGASYGGRDWYNGGAGDNRFWGDRYERGERGFSSYNDDRYRSGYGNDRGYSGSGYGGGYGDNERGYDSNYDRILDLVFDLILVRGYDDRYLSHGYGEDRGYRSSDDSRYGQRFGGTDGRSRGGYESSRMQSRHDAGRFAGRSYEDDRDWRHRR